MPGMEDSFTFSPNSSFVSAASTSFSLTDDYECDTHDKVEHQKEIKRLAKGQAAHNMRQLPFDYILSEYDVICGRGRRCFNHIGNQRFRKIVADMLPKYSDAATKLEKTIIICEVVNLIRRSSPQGGFVKKDPMTGRYFEVGDFLAVSRSKDCLALRINVSSLVLIFTYLWASTLYLFYSLSRYSERRPHKPFVTPWQTITRAVILRKRSDAFKMSQCCTGSCQLQLSIDLLS